jgi:RNA polymerase sigma factor (sigma-70 family)
MGKMTEAERYLLDQIRGGDEGAWCRFVEKFRGRLLNFAQSKLPQRADAEDIVQDTFVAFVTAVERYRGESSLETYLFTILRRKIINCYRSAYTRRICLIQDVYKSMRRDEANSDVFGDIASDDGTASFYARRDEQGDLLRESLGGALASLVDGYKKKLNFRDMQIVELLFYSQLSNTDIGKITNVNEKNIAVIKHRCLKQVRDSVARSNVAADSEGGGFEDMLTDVWESQRLSCPKRSTVGAYLLETLDEGWYDYVGFHLNTLGCQFCRANMEDIKAQTAEDESQRIQERIMESTVGFLHKPR